MHQLHRKKYVEGTVKEVHDPRFKQLVSNNAKLERLASGCLWAEGPVYRADVDMFIWSDIPNNRMLCWRAGQVSVFRQPSNYTNGHTLDVYGRLVSCEHGGRRVTRTEADGSITVLADTYNGKRLNSPNDVVVKSDGSVWFTDPSYGILSDYEGYQSEMEQPGCFVYRLEPTTGHLQIVADDFVKPNGLAFSVDESRLYIADSGYSHDENAPHHVRWFKVEDDHLSAGGVFADIHPGVPDGLRVDVQDNVWISAADGVHCYSSEGNLLGKILVPEVAANLSFGGRRGNQMFITATTSVYAMLLGVRGAR
ncbi:MAG: SMP-30/gluconolactonase/LRE family protein [Deinococcota bacterium]